MTQETAENTKRSVMFFLDALDMPKLIKLTQEIQSYNRLKKFELSLMRMQDIKYGLIQAKNNNTLKSFMYDKSFSEHITKLSIDMNSLEKELLSPSGTLRIVRLNGNLEALSNDLIHVETQLKHTGGNL